MAGQDLADGATAALLVTGTIGPSLALPWLVAGLARMAGGRAAGPLAVVTVAATPLALELGTRVLVEVTLAATVVAAARLAVERCRRPGVDSGMALAFGGAAGVALLAKLLAPLFLLPAVLLALTEISRREGLAAALRWGGLAGLAALAVALPWYGRNLPAAIEFARYAARHEPNLYALPWWTRPGRLVSSGSGLPLAAAWIARAVAARAQRGAVASGLGRLRVIALSTAALSAVVVGSQPVFDPRYWLLSLALLAAWAGVAASVMWSSWAAARWSVAVIAGALLVLSVGRLLAAERPRMAWGAAEVVAEIVAPADEAPLLCALGGTPEWNVEKLRLAVEMANLRPRPAVADLLGAGTGSELPLRPGDCDAIFALVPEELSPSDRASPLNQGLRLALNRLETEGSSFVLDLLRSRRLGSRAPVHLFRPSLRDD